jgi:predicted patatin/cPLA2 family phospholipase
MRMMKVINVITLIVMVCVNFMSPFAYVKASDVFEEVQNSDEITQENESFDIEEEIEDDTETSYDEESDS